MTDLNKILCHLHRVLKPTGDGDLTDGQLLTRFIASRDEASFAALVRRHGPMVWRLCRRVLGHIQDAEDAFQATFLVLARKAGAVVKRESVGSFLYGVAYRIAREAKAINAKRRSREKQVEQMPHPQIQPAESLEWLDHELNLLPEHYRAVIVACDLEGMSRKEASRHLGLSEGTVSSRLARGRRLLAKRLGLPAGALAAAVTEGAASAHVPASLLTSTAKTAVGQVLASSSVEILVKGALKAMLLTKLKVAVGAVMVMAALGASGLVYRASGQAAPQPKSDSKPRSELETLRRENELLKLNLEIVLEKVRAQEAELRALRGNPRKTVEAFKSADSLWEERALWSKRMSERGYIPKAQAEGDEARRQSARRALREAEMQDRLRDAEAALKALREAPDPESRRRAADQMEKVLKTLREQLKKPETPPAGK